MSTAKATTAQAMIAYPNWRFLDIDLASSSLIAPTLVPQVGPCIGGFCPGANDPIASGGSEGAIWFLFLFFLRSFGLLRLLSPKSSLLLLLLFHPGGGCCGGGPGGGGRIWPCPKNK